MGLSMAAQSRVGNAISVVLLLTLFLAWNSVAALFDAPGINSQHPAISETALATFIGWCLGVQIAISVRNPTSTRQQDAIGRRILYTWGCVMCWLHIAVAFHLAHGWSHAAAWEHVEQLSGFGAGLYVNYLFAVVWLADVLWAWVSLDGYLNRPRWMSWCIHGFMGFIVFNATVVFGTGFTRVFGALMFVAVALTMLQARSNRQMPEPGREPGSDPAIGLANDHSPT